MASGVLMPKAGISVESCIITEWLKKPGDQVAVGDILFSYETDKASFECESTESGELLEAFYGNGDEVSVLVNVCAIGKKGEDVTALRLTGDSAGAPTASESIAPMTKAVVSTPVADPLATSVPMDTFGKIKISPRAKNLARFKNIDLRMALPSGPYGRIIERDIRTMIEKGIGTSTAAAYDAFTSASPGKFSGTAFGGKVGVSDLTGVPLAISMSDMPEYEDIAFTGIRRAISKNMTQSLLTIPQLTHNFSFDATEILDYRAKIKKNAEIQNMPDITLNDFVLYAVSRLVLKYPEMNAHMLDGNNIRKFSNVHLGMAVDTERGLMVPVIKYANLKSLSQIAIEAKTLAKQAQSGTISLDNLSGGTFTISNLGALNVESFTPVINPPQTGILGVNNIIQRVCEVNGESDTYPAMGISLTYDHRAIDGAPASRFGSELCRALESFTLLLAK